jgi:hypothetical protein
VPSSSATFFRRVAELVGYSPEQIFISESVAGPPRLVKKRRGAPIEGPTNDRLLVVAPPTSRSK